MSGRRPRPRRPTSSAPAAGRPSTVVARVARRGSTRATGRIRRLPRGDAASWRSRRRGPSTRGSPPGRRCRWPACRSRVKDNIWVAGRRATCASRILEGFRPPGDSTVAARLREAGAVFVGRANMDEFAMGSSTENSSSHVDAQPLGPERDPGRLLGRKRRGRGGAASCPGGFGSDTGGSIRQPAACCGVVGFKPTYGRVSRYGLVAFASSLDQIGPLDALRRGRRAALPRRSPGADPLDSTTARPRRSGDPEAALERGVAGLRVGFLEEAEVEGLDPGGRGEPRGGAPDLPATRAREVVSVSVPRATVAIAIYYVVASAEASSNLARFDGVRYGPRASDASLAVALRREPHAPASAPRSSGGSCSARSRSRPATTRRTTAARCGRGSCCRDDFDRAFARGGRASCARRSRRPRSGIGEKTDDPLTMYLSDVFTVPASLAGPARDLGAVGPDARRPAARHPGPRPALRRGGALRRGPGVRGGRRLSGCACRRAARLACRSRRPAAAVALRRPPPRPRRAPREDRRRLARDPGRRSRTATRSSCSARPASGRGRRRLRQAPHRRPEAQEGDPGRQRRAAAPAARTVSSACRTGCSSATYRKIAIEALFPDDRGDAGGLGAPRHGPDGQAREPLADRRVVHRRRARTIARSGRRGAIAVARDARRARSSVIPPRLLTPVVPGGRRRGGAAGRGRGADARVRRGRAGPLRASTGCRRARRSTRPSSCGSPGRVHAEDVNAKAAEIARAQRHRRRARDPGRASRSRSRSPTSRRSSARPDDPERIEEEKARLEASQFANTVRSADLSGVTLVLDAGHGGRDTGAIVDGLEEARVRLRHRLPRRARSCAPDTRARVVPTVGRDAPVRGRGVRAACGDSRSARVLTTPPYPIEDAAAGVNFRWYLANSVCKHVREERRPARTGPSSSRSTRTRSTRRCAARWSTSRARSS